MISPISGIVDHVEESRFGVYIRGPFDEKQDDHSIYAPEDGSFEVETFDGNLTDSEKFIAKQGKVGKLTFQFPHIKFDILVREGYVTDQILVMKKKKVKKGEKIGYIVVGSYAFVYSKNSQIKKGTVLIGGVSSI